MKQKAVIKSISDIIEEEVVLEINGIELIAFGNYVPYKIFSGNEYSVMLHIFEIDDLSESTIKSKELLRTDNAFGYFIRGKLLKGGKVDAGVILENEYLEQFEYLIGQYVEFKTDRIDVEFLS